MDKNQFTLDLVEDVIGSRVWDNFGSYGNVTSVGKTWRDAGKSHRSRSMTKIKHVLKKLCRDHVQELVDRFPNIHIFITDETQGDFTEFMFNGIPLRYLTVEESCQLDFISELPSLIELTLIHVDMDSIPLSFLKLKQLRKLTILMSEDLQDIKVLSGLTNLVKLDLSYNYITDISPLAALVNLERLYLMHNSIVDISPLANLINLKKVELEGNDGLYNLTPLARRGLKLFI